jgi:hypothetical protein
VFQAIAATSISRSKTAMPPGQCTRTDSPNRAPARPTVAPAAPLKVRYHRGPNPAGARSATSIPASDRVSRPAVAATLWTASAPVAPASTSAIGHPVEHGEAASTTKATPGTTSRAPISR